MIIRQQGGAKKNFMKDPPSSPHGVAFLGRDINQWGDNGTGSVAIAESECPAPHVCPYDHHADDNDNRDHIAHSAKIHLVIASFRDRLCPRTLYNAFVRAEHPERLFVRVLQQVDPTTSLEDDADCFQRLCQNYNGHHGNPNQKSNNPPNNATTSSSFNCHDYQPQIEIVTMDARTAQGPCDARSKLSALLAHDFLHGHDPQKVRLTPVDARDDYCLQTDSHMDFSTHFDTRLIQMHHRTRNERAVLSTYVAPMEQNDKDPKEVPHLCMITWTTTWRNWGTKFLRRAQRPKLTNLVWGAGMSFHKCHAELNVPYDPFLDGTFDGEETSRGIRFFTHGYDVYTPDQVLVTHDYQGHQSNPHVHTWGHSGVTPNQNVKEKTGRELLDQVDWSFMNDIEQIRKLDQQAKPADEHLEKNQQSTSSPLFHPSSRRLNLLMGATETRSDHTRQLARLIHDSRYGLGKVRTLEQAYEFAGFDPVTHKMLRNRCGNIEWVPYQEEAAMGPENSWGVYETLARPLWSEATTAYQDLIRDHQQKIVRNQGENEGHDSTAASDETKSQPDPNNPSATASPIVSSLSSWQTQPALWILLLVILIVVRIVGRTHYLQSAMRRKSEKSKV